jgi:hypothetical protein
MVLGESYETLTIASKMPGAKSGLPSDAMQGCQIPNPCARAVLSISIGLPTTSDYETKSRGEIRA